MAYKDKEISICRNCGTEIIYNETYRYWAHTSSFEETKCRSPRPEIKAITTDELQQKYPGKKIFVYGAHFDQLWELTEGELSLLDEDKLRIYVEN